MKVVKISSIAEKAEKRIQRATWAYKNTRYKHQEGKLWYNWIYNLNGGYCEYCGHNL